MTRFFSLFSRVAGLTLILLAISFFRAPAQQRAERSPAGQGYLLHLPKTYHQQDILYPTLIFLHGIDEKGDGSAKDLQKLKAYGPPKWIEKGHDMTFTVNGMPQSYIVVSPQLAKGASGWNMRDIDNLISHVTETYKADPARIYLTGLSLGGNGTWRYGFDDRNTPARIAAMAPVAGWGNPGKACVITKNGTPIWAFHGENDRVIAESRDRSMVRAVRACNSEADITYTVYPETGHDSWTKAYDPTHAHHSPNMYEWLLQHSLPAKAAKKPGNKNPALKPTPEPEPEATTTEPTKKAPIKAKLKRVCQLPNALKETSGLLVDSPNRIWSHNDSGNAPVLFLTDTLGRVTDMKTITNAFNLDWEDLARDEEGNVYIGDFGNNRNNRRTLQIFKIPDPSTEEGQRIRAEKIEFTYPDQKSYPPDSLEMNFDMEAMIYREGHIYLFTKNRTQPYSGITKVYRLEPTPGAQEAILIDSLGLGGSIMYETWLGGADISPDGETIALLGYDKIFTLSCVEGEKFSEAEITTISLGGFSQKEGIGFINNHEVYITDEVRFDFLGGNLYRFNLSEYIKPCGD